MWQTRSIPSEARPLIVRNAKTVGGASRPRSASEGLRRSVPLVEPREALDNEAKIYSIDFPEPMLDELPKKPMADQIDGAVSCDRWRQPVRRKPNWAGFSRRWPLRELQNSTD